MSCADNKTGVLHIRAHKTTPAVLDIWRLWANVLKDRDSHAKPIVRKIATDAPARIFFKRILFLLSRQLPHRYETGSLSSQLSQKITCYVRRSYLLRRSWRCVLQRWNLGRNASCVMEDCKADGRSAHRQGIRMRHAKRRASSYESKPRTVRQAPSPRGRVKRRSAVPDSSLG